MPVPEPISNPTSQSPSDPETLAYQQALKYGQDLRRVYLAEKARRHELELKNQMMDAIFDSAPEGVIVLDTRLHIQQANQAFCQLVEQSEEALEGMPLQTVLPVPELIETLNRMSVGAGSDMRQQTEFQIDKPVQRSLLASMARLKSSQEAAGWVIVLHDNTERRQLEYQKMEFINLASHELRTPLTAVLAYSEMLRDFLNEQSGLNEDIDACITGILGGGYRLRDVIEQLVSFAQLSDGALMPVTEPHISLDTLVTDVCTDLAPHADNAQVKLTIASPLPEIDVHQNPVLLRAVLYQLVLNGIKFNASGGQLTVSAASNGSDVSFTIEDTGMGIPEAELETVFEPFYQVEDHNTRHVGGLGLGLSIVRRAVQQMNGEINITSKQGHGTCVTLTLPITLPQDNKMHELEDRLSKSHQQTLTYAKDMRFLYQQLKDHTVETLAAITGALEARDDYTRGHTQRVTEMALQIAVRMGFSAEQLENLRIACQLHDIGKLAMPDNVIQHADGRPDHHYALINHIQLGRHILAPLEFLSDVAPIAFAHHEHFDGQGFPDGLASDNIPLGARILAVANDYDIMTSPRPDRDALTHQQALDLLVAGAGTQWDPQVVSVFCEIVFGGTE